MEPNFKIYGGWKDVIKGDSVISLSSYNAEILALLKKHIGLAIYQSYITKNQIETSTTSAHQ